MADPTADLGPDDADAPRDRGPIAGMPRWVKGSLIVVVILVLLFLVAQVAGIGGDHGPGRHGGPSDTPTSVVSEDTGHTPPVDHGP